MPERSDMVGDYRYGFNGKEKDEDEEWGDLTHYDYGFRIYNPGVGRFLSVDPLTRQYSMLTPYQFASNSPIAGIDLDGLEFLDAEESLINITVGSTSLKMENATGPTRARARNSRSYTYFDASINNYVIESTFDYNIADGYEAINDKIEIARNGYAGPLSSAETRSGLKRDISETRPNGGNAKQRRKYDRAVRQGGNYPGQTGIVVGPSVPKAGTVRGAGAAIAVGAINEGLLIYINHKVNQDYEIAQGQLQPVATSIDIIRAATEVPDLIPDQFNTDRYKAELANYVLQGTFVLDHTDEVRKELEKVAIKIILSDERVSIKDPEAYQKVREDNPKNNKP